eukprot:3703610-Pyramimonas_sp.AAC.1
MLWYAELVYAVPRHATSCYAFIFNAMSCHVMLCHATHPPARIETRSTPWQGMGGRGRKSDNTLAHLACPPP